MEPQSVEVAIEIDGPGMDLDSIDSHAALRFFAAFVAAAKTAAEAADAPFDLRGLHTENKCTRMKARTSRPDVVRTAMLTVTQLLQDTRKGLAPVRASMSELGPAATMKAIVAGEIIPITSSTSVREEKTYELMSLRLRILSCGGRVPGVQAIPVDQIGHVRFKTSRDMAIELAKHLYREIEAEVEALVHQDGRVLGGRIDAFEPVLECTHDEAVEAWRAWLGSAWDDVEDVESELDR